MSAVPAAFGSPAAVWTEVSSAHDHSCGISQGVVACWGGNSSGEVTSIASSTPIAAPSPIITSQGQVWSHVSAGAYHSCAVATNGTVQCWGNGQQIGGMGSTGVHAIQSTNGVKAISAGFDHTCAIDTANTVVCWGANAHGQSNGDGGCTGNSDCPEVDVATPIAPVTPAIQVSAGAEASCAIVGTGTQGELWCWGTTRVISPLGTGNLSPTRMDTNADWTDVSVGDHGVCAIRRGLATCWGAVAMGGLGDGKMTETIAFAAATATIPADHVSLTRARDGSERACAILNGNATCWGPPSLPMPVPQPTQ